MKISVFYGSVRPNRQGIKAARFVTKQLKSRGHDVELLDAMELQLPMIEKMYKSYDEGEAPQELSRLSKIISDSDAFVVVSGEYNHSIPPGLKNILDYFQKEYFFKTCGIVTYSAGPFGGVRVGVHLRAILGELGMVTIPTMLPVSAVGKSFDDDGNAIDEAYNKRIQKFIGEFEWYAAALNAQRKNGTPH